MRSRRRRWLWVASAAIAGLFATVAWADEPLWKTLPEPPPLPPADESGLAPVNDIKLYYAIFNKGGREPVILLHGAFGSAEVWGFEIPLLARTHEVIAVDSRGHGRSTRSAQPFTYALMTSDVLALMDYLRISRASVVGWSDGGIIGLVMAIRHPERVDKLFAFGANFNRSGEKSDPPDPALVARFRTRAQATYRRLSPTPDDFPNFAKALSQLWAAEPDLKPAELGTITAPTVIADGEYEQFYTREHIETLAHLIPGAKLVIMPNVGHGGPAQDPVRFHEAVAKLLDGGP